MSTRGPPDIPEDEAPMDDHTVEQAPTARPEGPQPGSRLVVQGHVVAQTPPIPYPNAGAHEDIPDVETIAGSVSSRALGSTPNIGQSRSTSQAGPSSESRGRRIVSRTQTPRTSQRSHS